MARAKSALAAESRFTSALLDAATAFVATVDFEGRIIRCNSACEAFLGRQRSEIEGKYAWEVIDWSQNRVLEWIGRCRQAGGTRSFESSLPSPDGRDLTVAWSTVGVHDDSGDLAFLVATGQDITSHREAERKLQEAYELEHHIAETLQESLLRPIPDIPGLELGVAYKPAIEAERVGGDFYDIYQISPDRVVMVVGDVSGKGVTAAGLTETVRSTLRALLYMNLPLGDALTRAGDVLYEQTAEEHFATVGVGLLDLRDNRLYYSSAGHPPPIVFDREPRFLETPQGVPLGAYPHRYEQTSVLLKPGDCVVWYTDGLSEARRGQAFFSDELLSCLVGHDRDPKSLVQSLLEGAESFSDKPLGDDVVIVALRISEQA